MLRHVYDVSNMDTQIVYRFWKLESLIFVIRPKPWYVWAEFYLAGHLTELTNHAAVILLYFQKTKRLRLTFSFNYSTFSFSTMKTREM